MPIIQFKVDKSGNGGDSYLDAQHPDIDLLSGTQGANTTGGASQQWIPDYFLIRSDAGNADEVLVSFDGANNALQMPLVANNGGFYVHVPSHAQKVWVKRIGAGNAAAIALITAGTNA